MFVAALACTTVLFVLVLLQFFWSRRFAELFQPAHTESQHAEASPKAVVLLSLRGADPFLGDCIRGLLNQTYTNFDARIIVDSREDQAWNVVQDLLREYDTDSSVSIEVIEKRHGTCTLKLSALIQAIESLDDSYDVVAFLDADVCPHPEWLADLVAPFADPVVGATTGLRYYQAAYSNAGTLVRYLWNLAAL
jgi:cellulose synthase/poly-beta-1,6-N-acetylglucosamine synthase-like glycosyltransferase